MKELRHELARMIVGVSVAVMFAAGCGDNPANPGGAVCDHVDADGLVVSLAGAPLVAQWQGNITGEVEVPVGEVLQDLLVTFLNPDSTAISVSPNCTDFSLRWSVADTTIADISQGTTRWSLNVIAKREGETLARVRVWHGDHADFTSLEFPLHAAVEVEVVGAAITVGTTPVWSQWEGVQTGGLAAAVGTLSEVGTATFFAGDSTNVDLEPGATLEWTVADPSKIRFDAVTGQPNQFRMTGLATGATTVQLRILHHGHYDFTSQPIPVMVEANPLEPHALWILDGCNPIATWAYDTTNGPALASGPILVPPGTTRANLAVRFLSDHESPEGIRDEITFPPEFSMDWTVASPTIANVTRAAGQDFDVDVAGLSAGSTTVQFRLLRQGSPVYTTGGIPIQVATTPPAHQDFVLRKNGIWTVMVQGGAVVDSACGRGANPGQLTAAVGELTDLYSIRFIDAACATPAPGTSYSLLFDFDDPCIGRIINHPVHWGEKLIFHLQGLAAGVTSLRITALDNGQPAFVSPPLPVVITPVALTRGST